MSKNIIDIDSKIVINQCFDKIFNITNKDLNNVDLKEILNDLLDIQYYSITLELCCKIVKRNNII